MIYLYFTLSIIFFIIALSIVQSRLYHLNRHPEVYDASYDGHEKFLVVFFGVIKYYTRKLQSAAKLVYQNILHLFVRFVAKVNSISEKAYMRSRDKFVEEVVKDKKAVPHFWDHLKKYKREKDEEKEEEINNEEIKNI